MQEQLSKTVVFYAFYTASGLAKTGLTVTVDVYSPAGSLVETAQAAVEVGDGIYSYSLDGSHTGTAGEYVAVFKTSDGTVDQRHLPALWVIGRDGDVHLDADLSGIKAKTDLITSGAPVTLVSPVGATGNVEVVQGDDYRAADGRALVWTGTTWPSLTSATVILEIRPGAVGSTIVTLPATAPTSSSVQVELTAAQTGALPNGSGTYALKATLADGHTVTIVTGQVSIVGQP